MKAEEISFPELLPLRNRNPERNRNITKTINEKSLTGKFNQSRKKKQRYREKMLYS